MRLLGQLEHGVYVDELDDVPPEELAAHYGVDDSDNEDFDEDPDEDSDSDDNSEPDQGVTEDANNPAPSVPDSRNPFPDDETEDVFNEVFRYVREQVIVPPGYGILPQEWEDGAYPTIEVIRAGRRGRRELAVGLADEIWRPRAMLWVQAVYALTRVLDYRP